MDILSHIQQLNKQGKYDKVLDIDESLSDDKRTPEIDHQIVLAILEAIENEEPAAVKLLLMRAVELSEKHVDNFAEDQDRNYILGVIYSALDWNTKALEYYLKAINIPSDDENKFAQIRVEVNNTLTLLANAHFGGTSFKESVKNWWEFFSNVEKIFRQKLQAKELEAEFELFKLNKELLALMKIYFSNLSAYLTVGENKNLMSFGIGTNNKVWLHLIEYIISHAPKKLLKHWNIVHGRTANQIMLILFCEMFGCNVDNIQVWLERDKDKLKLSVHCKELLPIFEKHDDAYHILNQMLDYAIGELSHIKYFSEIKLLKRPKNTPSIPLSKLAQHLTLLGYDLSSSYNAYLSESTAYSSKPPTAKKKSAQQSEQESEQHQYKLADFFPADAESLRREEVFGHTSIPSLINEFYDDNPHSLDMLNAEGATAGFICIPLDDNTKSQVERLKRYLTRNCPDSQVIIGQAVGKHFYLDLLSFDIKDTLKVARKFFKESNVPWAKFQVFSSNLYSIDLK